MSTGFSYVANELGFIAVKLHYSADDEKNVNHPDPETAARAQKWFDSVRRSYPDPNQWAQEMEVSWWISAGQRVYPEFLETVHCQALELRRRKVIYRAWDFGYLTPAVLIAQIDERDRLCVTHEVIGKEETTRQFAQKVIAKCAGWFPNHAPGYQDFCDPAGQKRGSVSGAADEKSEIRDVEVLNTLGIHPKWEYGWSRKDGRSLVHQLLAERLDRTPGMYVDPSKCPTLLQGFLGKYVFPPRKGGQAHDEPDEANHPWADAHACLRYLCTGLYSALGLRRASQVAPPVVEPNYHGYGVPIRGRVKR
jgi:hypothetical protein